MTEYAVMPMEDWQDVVDATREKTGTSDLIRSGEVAEMIRSIDSGGGGGSTEDLSAELSEQEALLTELGENLGVFAPTITIDFVGLDYEYYTYYPVSQSGHYRIGDGETVSFNNVTSITLGFVPIGTTITVKVDGDADSYADETNCTVDMDWSEYAFKIVPTAEGASVKLYYYG